MLLPFLVATLLGLILSLADLLKEVYNQHNDSAFYYKIYNYYLTKKIDSDFGYNLNYQVETITYNLYCAIELLINGHKKRCHPQKK